MQKEENMCPEWVWRRKWRLGSRGERMWGTLQAVLPGGEHMLAVNRRCRQKGPLVVQETDLGGGTAGQLRTVELEGESVWVLHVRRQHLRMLARARIHHATFIRRGKVVPKREFRVIMNRGKGGGDRGRWNRKVDAMWGWWSRRRWRNWTDTEDKRGDEQPTAPLTPLRRARHADLLCVPLRLKGPRGQIHVAGEGWWQVQEHKFRGDNISKDGKGVRKECWKCDEAGAGVPWPVLELVKMAMPQSTLRAPEEVRAWWRPVLRPGAEYDAAEEGGCVDEAGGTVRWGGAWGPGEWGVHFRRGGLRPQDAGGISFKVEDAGRPGEEDPVCKVGHECRPATGERISVFTRGLPDGMTWLMAAIYAYLV